MEITLADFTPADFERCLEIRIQNYQEVNKTPEKILGVREYFLSSLGTRTYFVAKEGEKIVGMGGYYENHLSSFFVDPSYQGKGIGKLLMEKVLSEIQQLGYQDANLNATEYAKTFYEKFGFVVESKTEHGYLMKKIF